MEIKALIKTSLDKSISYVEFRKLLERLVEDKSTTGSEQTTDLINYTALNYRRVKRWEKTVSLSEEEKKRLSSYKTPTTWLILTESWCGDAAHILPILQKIALSSNSIDIQIVLRDENSNLMDEFLTNGSRSIPKIIGIEKSTLKVLYTYGPRPSLATQKVDDFKLKHGKLTDAFKEELQQWYNKDKGVTIVKDVFRLLDV